MNTDAVAITSTRRQTETDFALTGQPKALRGVTAESERTFSGFLGKRMYWRQPITSSKNLKMCASI